MACWAAGPLAVCLAMPVCHDKESESVNRQGRVCHIHTDLQSRQSHQHLQGTGCRDPCMNFIFVPGRLSSNAKGRCTTVPLLDLASSLTWRMAPTDSCPAYMHHGQLDMLSSRRCAGRFIDAAVGEGERKSASKIEGLMMPTAHKRCACSSDCTCYLPIAPELLCRSARGADGWMLRQMQKSL